MPQKLNIYKNRIAVYYAFRMNIKTILERGVDEVIERDHLEGRLAKGDKLRVKLGIDPTAKDLHLGHTVVLRKMRQFQDLGHQAVLIIGDFTAKVGDPSGKNESRPQLTDEQIKDNLKEYLDQASKVIDIKKTEVRYNSEWLAPGGTPFLLELTSKFTVARSLERDDFQKRLKDNRDISVLEILYPLLQGYDSVAVKADVELGGTDQKFNLLTGRKVQRRYGQAEQDIITSPLIEGLDGVKKMSKSLGNYISLSDSAQDMFNKTMSIPDALMVKYFTLLTDVSDTEISQLENDQLNPSLASQPQLEWKKRLASEIVSLYHGQNAAKQSQAEFENVFSKGKLPEEIPEHKGAGQSIIDVMVESGLSDSRTQAKQLIDQEAVTRNGEKVEWGTLLQPGDVVKVGPRKFLRII
ncbi:MAG TPA: tyrosine--tRNA ligase [Candidatus Paceibacterota bacterium]